MENNEVVFKGLFQGKKLEEAERLFFEKTDITLKEFLSQKYVKEGITTKQLAAMFDCSNSTMYLKLKGYNIARNPMESTRNFLLRQNKKIRTQFNKKPSDIEFETGKKFVDVVKEYLSQGYAPSEIARELKLANQSNIQKILKALERGNQEVVYPNIFGNNRKIEKSEQLFFENFGMNLREFLYQKYVSEKYSTYEIAPLFGVTASTIYQKVKFYGFSRNLGEARRLLIDKGDINYKKILIKSKKTSRKSSSNSNNQEFIRDIFKYHFENICCEEQFEHIEVVIGYDDWSILKDKEIDIPIIIINNQTNQFFKFAIEFNGKHVHSTQERTKNDEKKVKRLVSNGWTFYEIWDSPYHSVMEGDVIKIVDLIIKKISS